VRTFRVWFKRHLSVAKFQISRFAQFSHKAYWSPPGSKLASGLVSGQVAAEKYRLSIAQVWIGLVPRLHALVVRSPLSCKSPQVWFPATSPLKCIAFQ